MNLAVLGAPDLVGEILSTGNNSKELLHKYEVYEESGVMEYWVIHPNEYTLLIYFLVNGKFSPSRLYTIGDIVHSEVIKGFSLDLEDVFRNV